MSAPLPLPLVLAASLGWLVVLWAVAAWAERRAAAGRSVVARPTVYALSLAVYCTAWTYYGSVGRAAAGGPAFLAIYLGPTLAMALAWLVLRKMVRIAREQRLTSIADFIASRHGHSRALAALVSAVALVGVVPYVALQLKAVAHGVGLLTGVAVGEGLIAAAAAALLAAFTIAFGTRTLDARERHEGLVAAVAAESVFKLAAFVGVGVFVCWGLFDGPGDIAARVAADAVLSARLLPAAGPGGFDAMAWTALVLLAALSVLLLPRQFQVAVVENVDERHLKRASWLFPAYLLAINLFVLPIAWGGLLVLGPQADADGFVLALPLQAGQPALALLAYLGGLSAATGMVVVEAIAVGTMVSNDLVLPALLRRGAAADAALAPRLLRVRRVAIVALLALGWLYLQLAGESRSLVSIGLVSFAAVAQFAPALLLGLFWQGGTKAGALAGLAVGAGLWAVLLLAPALAPTWGAVAGVPLAEGLFWSLGANLALYVGVSLWRPPQGAEAAQALRFVGALEQGAGERVFWAGRARAAALVALLERVLGPGRGAALGAADEAAAATPRQLQQAEALLAGAVGAATARALVATAAEAEPLGAADVLRLADEARALRQRNEQLESLDRLKDDFMGSVTHELRTPLTSIRALGELMRDEPGMPEAQRQRFVGIVVDESERLSRLVNQVLDLAKIEAGQADWRPERLDVVPLLARAAQAADGLFRARRAELRVDAPARAPAVEADADRLLQVLINLLANAARFVPEGRGRVVLRLVVAARTLTIEVQDNGPGVPLAEQATVFEKFRQAGGPRERAGGTGLGLPISRRIVEHFGGRLWLASRPGEGATFGVELPRADPDTTTTQETTP
ncbi:MAG: ATP-binding protein [Rubrivivax sp.]|jgi:Na+/proline symporter/nitrogen-specific signal transduction histidine kinase|nr:ATP-binding protein [Rubrivivax sp.]